MMNNHDFAGLCRFYFGPSWQEAAAGHFDINIRTIQYWVAGKKAVPKDIMIEILGLAGDKLIGMRVNCEQ